MDKICGNRVWEFGKKKKRKYQMGRGEIVPKTEQVRKNVKV